MKEEEMREKNFAEAFREELRRKIDERVGRRKEFCSVCEILKLACEFVDNTGECARITEDYLSKKISPEEHEKVIKEKYGDRYMDAINKANVIVARKLGYTDEEIRILLKEKGLSDKDISKLLDSIS